MAVLSQMFRGVGPVAQSTWKLAPFSRPLPQTHECEGTLQASLGKDVSCWLYVAWRICISCLLGPAISGRVLSIVVQKRH
jgi:hypothetical protein